MTNPAKERRQAQHQLALTKLQAKLNAAVDACMADGFNVEYHVVAEIRDFTAHNGPGPSPLIKRLELKVTEK